MTTEARDSGIRRLAEALAERKRAAELYTAELGTAKQLSAYARLRGADDQVSAREAWLKRVDKGSIGTGHA